MNNTFTYTDSTLGTIFCHTSPRAKNFVIRIKDGQISVTVPPTVGMKQLQDMISKNRDSIAKMQERHKALSPATGYATGSDVFSSHWLTVKLQQQGSSRWTLARKGSTFVIGHPADADLSSQQCKTLIRKTILKCMKAIAHETLPARVAELAAQHGFGYNTVKISSAHTRWGSCSSQKVISLSAYLMKMPPHLVDYVLLHELCHTVEMNHSPRFWALMDKVTDNKAHALRAGTRKFTTSL